MGLHAACPNSLSPLDRFTGITYFCSPTVGGHSYHCPTSLGSQLSDIRHGEGTNHTKSQTHHTIGGHMDEEQRKIQKLLNQAKKRELAQKYGARFSENSEIPPEVESQWLDNIEEYERQFEDARRGKVREFRGGPMFKPFEEIQPEQVESELDKVLEFLS